MGRLSANYMNQRTLIPPQTIFNSKMSLWKPLDYRYEISGMDVNDYDKTYGLSSVDYIELLGMDYTLMMKKDPVNNEYNYIKLLQGMRKVSQTKCILEYDISRHAENRASFNKIAEVGVGITMSLKRKNQVQIYIIDNSTDYRGIYFGKEENRNLTNSDSNFYDMKAISKALLKEIGQSITLNFEYEIDLSKLRVYKTLNTIVLILDAKSAIMVAQYYVISLRGRVLPLNSKEAAVLPICQKFKSTFLYDRIFTERIWWYDLNIINSFQYIKGAGDNPDLIERTCVVGVYRSTTYNMYFRCAYEYAEFKVYQQKQNELPAEKVKDWLGYKSFKMMLQDDIGDLKKTKEPYIKGVERFYNLKPDYNLITNSLKFVMKIPDKFSYMLKMSPEIDVNSKYISVQIREIYNPFTGFQERFIFPDISMNNVYIRPMVFEKKSFLIFYYLNGNLDNSANPESQKV